MEDNRRILEKDLNKSLYLVIAAITFGNVFFVVTTGPALTGFTRALGAGDLVYGIVMAMPVVGGILQVFVSYYLEYTGKRRFAFLTAGFIHRLLWIPIALIPLILPSEYKNLRIWLVTILITLSSSANSVAGICFWSWMGDLVPKQIRGSFFSKRTMISTISSAIIGLAVGRLLDLVNNFTGFAIILIVIALFGACDILCFCFVSHPAMITITEKQPIKELFIEPFKNSNYMRFVTFVSVWNFGVNIAGPFFNVYMLEHLKMSYFTLVIFAQVGGNLITILFIRFWGKLVDRYGNRPVMTICCSITFFLPFLWFFATPQNYWIILFINLLSGLFWPGFDMTCANQSVWLAPDKNRSMHIAVYALITSLIGIAAAYICGGFIMQFSRPLFEHLNLPFVMGQKFSAFHLLFALSGLIRFIALILFSRGYSEPNSKSSRMLISDLFIKTTR